MQASEIARLCDIDRKLQAMAVRVKEVDGAENTVMRGAQHRNILLLQLPLRREQRLFAVQFERDVLHPFRRVVVAPHRG